MNLQINKKKLAREILISLGSFGLMLLVLLTIWMYSIFIKHRIENKIEEINIYKTRSQELSSVYDSKMDAMKTLIKSCDNSDGLSISNFYEIGIVFNHKLSKENSELLNKYLKQQDINGKIPSIAEFLEHKACHVMIRDYSKSYNVLSEYDIKRAWECIIDIKEDLFYLMPINNLEKLKIKSRAQLLDHIRAKSLNEEDKANKIKSEKMLKKIRTLQKERAVFQTKIASSNLTRIFKTVIFSLLIIVYPLRLIIIIFIWALRNYK